MKSPTGRHGTVIIENIALVSHTSDDVMQLTGLDNVFMGDTRANQQSNNHNKITFKIYCPGEGQDMIARLSLILEPGNTNIPFTSDNNIEKYFEGAIINKLFPKKVGNSTRNIDDNILALLLRNGLIDLNGFNEEEKETILNNKKTIISPLLDIFSNHYNQCMIIKNGLSIEKLGALCLILNKEIIDDSKNENLIKCIEKFNRYEEESNRPGSTISQD